MLLKVCGLKDPENIKQVAALKPDFMGFIFYPQSKRFVGEDFIMPAISLEIKKVGVFVNASANHIIEKTNEYKLDLIQLHGDEPPEFCEDLSLALSLKNGEETEVVSIIKAFRIDENFDFNVLKAYKNCCDYFLFDTKTNEYGGSGKQFDWKLLEKYDNSVPFFLSGGIGAEEFENLKMKKFKNEKIFAIDVNSKFEIEPGIKDIKKLEKCIK